MEAAALTGGQTAQDPLSQLQSEMGDDASNSSSRAAPLPDKRAAEVQAAEPDDEETYHSSSTTNSYRDEWFRLFEQDDPLAVVRNEGKKGRLRSSRFRSVCWKLYLECLSEDRATWLESTKKSREKYDGFRRKHIQSTKEELLDTQMDPTLNNPLSQLEESPWNKFFQDKDCRSEIKQDVVRCFPEIAFFKSERVRDMMIDILFCFAKENSHVLYKQGMHELLAPLMFVLHSDHQAYLHAAEMESQLIVGPNESQREIVTVIMNPDYLEHDSYTLFCHLMETAEPWFHHGQDFPPQVGGFVQSEPFARPEDVNPSSPLVKKLNRIKEFILKKHDYELYSHLSRLDIQPQIYGIRWLRLLFGREFTFQDLIVLWDAIFADSPMLDLVDYIFVAMLIKIRELLLTADYASALMLLMRYPTVDDIHYLVNRALHLRDPKNNPRQANYQFQIYSQVKSGNVLSTSRGHVSVPKKPLPVSNMAKKTSSAVTQGFNSLKRIGKGAGGGGQRDKGARVGKSKSTEDLPHPLAQSTDVVTDIQKRDLKVISKQNPTGAMETLGPNAEPTQRAPLEKQHLAPSQPKLFTRPRSTSKKQQQQHHQDSEAEQQLALVQSKFNELQTMCKYCATKMEAHILTMQDGLLQLNLETDDELFVSLAGLKQVKDIMHGKLRFTQGLIDSDEITINDDYFAQGEEEDEAMISIIHSDQSHETTIDKAPQAFNNNNGTAAGKSDPDISQRDAQAAQETPSQNGSVRTNGQGPSTSGSSAPVVELQDCVVARDRVKGEDVDSHTSNGGKAVPAVSEGLGLEKKEEDAAMCNSHPLFES